MKKLLTVLAILGNYALYAQAAVVNNLEAGVTGGNVTGGSKFPHFVFIPENNTNPQPSYMRLVSYIYAKHDGSQFVLEDSTKYEYHNNSRGGGIVAEDLTNDERVLFDESYSYVKGISGMVGIMKRMQTYDAENQVTNLTFMPWRQNGWVDSARYLYGYNNHKMTISALEVWVANQWDPHVKSNISYNNAGRVVELEATNYKMYFTYDGNNNLIELWDQAWSPLNGWVNKTRNTYTYDLSGMQSQTLENWNGTGWEFETKWEYTYFANKVETMVEYKRSGNSWTPVNKYTYTYGNKMQRTSETLQVWSDANNSFVNSKYTEFIYATSADVLLLEVATRHWEGNNWIVGANDEQYRYNYEPYFPTSVSNVAIRNEVNLHPIPASTTLNLNIGWDIPEPFSVAICDMRGVVVRNWTEQGTKMYNKQIDVSDLPSGSYVIRAHSSSSQLMERFIVAK